MTQSAMAGPTGQTFGAPAPARRGWLDPPALFAAFVVAAILTTAAIMKVTAGSPPKYVYYLAPFEIAFSIAVIALHSRRITWLGVTMLFGAFAGYAAHKWHAGEPCACFGEGTKPGFSFGLDMIGVATGLIFLTRHAKPGADPFGYGLTAAAAAATVGIGVSIGLAPPSAAEFARQTGAEAHQQLLRLPEMAEALNSGPEGPAWLIYIYNPDCQLCLEHLPSFQEDIRAHGSDSTLRVQTVSMEMLDAREGDERIPLYAWGDIPTTLLVQSGVVTKRWRQADIPEPSVVRANLGNTDRALARLLSLPFMGPIVQGGAEDPEWLVYLYTTDCELCIDHRSEYQRYNEAMPEDDPFLRIRMIDMQALQDRDDIPITDWGQRPFSFRMKSGEVIERYPQSVVLDPWGRRREIMAERGM